MLEGKRITRGVLRAAGIALLALLLGTASDRPVTAAPGPAAVVVINDTTQPVPTQSQGITWVQGDVLVGNGPATALYVRRAEDPVYGQNIVVLPENTTSGSVVIPLGLPAGRQMVVDQISIFTSAHAGDRFRPFVSAHNCAGGGDMVLSSMKVPADTSVETAFNLVRWYVRAAEAPDPACTLAFTFERDTLGHSDIIIVEVNGHTTP